MNLHILQLPKLIAERRSSAIFGVVIIAMLWAGVALKYVIPYFAFSSSTNAAGERATVGRSKA